MALQSTDPTTNPLYYLDYLEFLLEFVSDRYRNVLLVEETQSLDRFLACSLNARALYGRLLTRKPSYFRVDKITYPEISDIPNAIDELIRVEFLEPVTAPRRDLDISMRSKAELKSCGALRVPGLAQAHRQVIDQALITSDQDIPKLMIVRQRKRGLMSICQHLFFGNPHQHLDEFVRTDLGHQVFESVDLSLSRSFLDRETFDLARLLAVLKHWATELEVCSRQLRRSPDPIARLDLLRQLADLKSLMPFRSKMPSLSRLQDKLYLLLGQSFERLGATDDAISCYRGTTRPPSRERQARLQSQNTDIVRRLCFEILEASTDASELSYAHKQLKHENGIRLNGIQHPRPQIPRRDITLEIDISVNIEQQIVDVYKGQGLTALHIENHLFPGLFGLLFWEVIFLPIQGAFHHPFERGPADLYEPDFYNHRAQMFEARFNMLANSEYRADQLGLLFGAKQGITNPFVYWPAVSLDLFSQVMTQTPWSALEAIFRRLLKDPKTFRKGFPDLVVLRAETYELIEIKGPGDRLQNHQIAWLEFLIAQGITASTLFITAEEPRSNECELS